MAEQTPGNNPEQGYQPDMADWRALVVLAPELGQEAQQDDAQTLAARLGSFALELSDLIVTTPEVTDTIELSFYIGDRSQKAAIAESIGSIRQAALEARLGLEFVDMQLGRVFDIQLYGEEYFASQDCNVGEAANDTYRRFTDAHDSLGRLD